MGYSQVIKGLTHTSCTLFVVYFRESAPLSLAEFSSDASETGSCQSLVDAKRKFFSQPATPLRIDARRLFADGDAAAHSTTPSPQAGVPPSNRATGSTGVLLANLTLLAFVVNNTYMKYLKVFL